MAPEFISLAFWHFVVFAVAIVVRKRGFAAKRLTGAELAAQAGFVHAYIKSVLRGTRATKADVDELSQDVMGAAWEASEAGRYMPDPNAHPVKALQGWLLGISRYHVLHFVSSARYKLEDLIPEPIEGVDEAPPADDALDRDQERESLLKALLRVPDGSLVVAHDIEGESMQSIAARLGIPVSTAYKWRIRGLAALGEALRPKRG